ncbi:hypothetical protein CkaCkLH20_12627 [Colletotrichum karsti]|uniref:Uncharacterized protein n=1 Tax=Colletotrichum karsti TaxID=1095194 RepID=A0A9P6I120_9PEZI|nr:uncharacterized protein CkaCkLH20_12627 [Colletotrichum karsti]KAF9869920.1 hypothetical protein CkaCkLH20_12627 [Colletotrichum karsti]
MFTRRNPKDERLHYIVIHSPTNQPPNAYKSAWKRLTKGLLSSTAKIKHQQSTAMQHYGFPKTLKQSW